MEKSRGLDLKPTNYDENLVDAQMALHFVEGIGFGGYRPEAIIDPAEIFKTKSGEVGKKVSEEHEAVLRRKAK